MWLLLLGAHCGDPMSGGGDVGTTSCRTSPCLDLGEGCRKVKGSLKGEMRSSLDLWMRRASAAFTLGQHNRDQLGNERDHNSVDL